MYLVQVLLPQASNDGRPFEGAMYEEVRRELTEKFGGVTVYSQGLADGLWMKGDAVIRDTMILFEVMGARLRPKWWKRYREQLETRFGQEVVVVRAQRIRRL